jgi:hypothetical protein
MTLFHAYLLLGGVLLALAALFAANLPLANRCLLGFHRSLPVTILLVAVAMFGLYLAIDALGEADLATFPKENLQIGFGVIALVAFFAAPDLLGIRALAVIMLLAARALLDLGYMQLPYSIPLAATSYALVVFGILWGASPYFLRDWLEWLLAQPRRARLAAVGLAALAAVNLAAAFFVPATTATV